MKNNDNKKKKIAVIVIAVVILLLVIIGSGVALGVFRSTKGSASGRGDKKAFTNKLTTEATTLAKATTKAITEKATTEKAKKTTTEKAKKVASVSGGITTESKNDSNTKATTEKATQAPSEAPYVPDTEAPYVPDTEAPTEAPTQAPTEAPTEAPTTQHQHTWEDVTETVTENVKVKDAWDEQVVRYKCSYCGAWAEDVGDGHINRCGEKYYEVNIILLGDVFHRAYQDVNAAVISNNFWVISKKLFKHIYCVIGNHETSYYSNNPFYTLVSEIKSKKMQTVLNKVYTPRGLDNVFEVVDAVEDGDVVFHFNHYGCSISHAVDRKVNIGLYHQDILNSEILKLMQATYNNDVYAPRLLDFDKLDIFDGFTYNFFGHMHQVYGTWGYTNPKTETMCAYDTLSTVLEYQ